MRRFRPRVLVGALATVAAGVLAGAASAAAPANTTPPSISGTPTVGQTLTASEGAWTNAPTSFDYQWLRCNGGGNSCVDVANGTQKAYTLVGADAGHTMRVRVTATNADGSSSARSAQTAQVAAATSSAAPKNTAPPTVSGTARSGQQVTADPGSWTGSPTSFAYQWQRCGRRRLLLEHHRRNREDVRHPEWGRRLPAARESDRPERQGLDHGHVRAHGDRGTRDGDQEPSSERHDPQSPVHRRDRVRDVPRVRRLVQEPRDQGDRLPAGEALVHPTLRDARTTEAVRCLHTALAAGHPVPRPRPVHADAQGDG